MSKIVELGYNEKRKENYVILRHEFGNKVVWQIKTGMKNISKYHVGYITDKEKDELWREANFSYSTNRLKDAHKYI